MAEPGRGAGGAVLPISPNTLHLTAFGVDGLQGPAAKSTTIRVRGLEGMEGVVHRERKLLQKKLSLPPLGGLWGEATVLYLLGLALAYLQIQQTFPEYLLHAHTKSKHLLRNSTSSP